ncbi:MAG TPA: hypothetical protein VNN75_04250 [Stellaceae bacterium]|nr:hypothetical protein [Stellaceae bacterium]
MQGLRVTSHVAKVSDAAQLEPFRDEIADRHCTEKIHLLFQQPRHRRRHDRPRSR